MLYDVAFSLLSRDVRIVEAIQKFLPDDVTSYLYTKEQRIMILNRDGLNSIPKIFRDSRLCVVLYREQWGKTKWTRLEKRVIGDRFMDEDSKFLMLVKLEPISELPNWFPRSNIWVDYFIDGPEKTALYITDQLKSANEEYPSRVTARSVIRQPIPIARYQSQVRKIILGFEATDPEICDGCTRQIEFLPVVRVTLPSEDHFPSSTELLCPVCARDRGISVQTPRGMDKATVFSKKNPSYKDHIYRLLKYEAVLSSLTGDHDIQKLGITNVGATISGMQVELVLSVGTGSEKKLEYQIKGLEKLNLKSSFDLIKYFKKDILSSFGAV
jgi:hypothetical protein